MTAAKPLEWSKRGGSEGPAALHPGVSRGQVRGAPAIAPILLTNSRDRSVQSSR